MASKKVELRSPEEDAEFYEQQSNEMHERMTLLEKVAGAADSLLTVQHEDERQAATTELEDALVALHDFDAQEKL